MTPASSEAARPGTAPAAGAGRPGLPWLSIVPCVIAIMAVANLQYTWTLFADPLMKGLGVKLSAVQLGFSLYIMAQTWLAPFEGWLADRFAPRLLAVIGGALVGLNWVGAGLAQSVWPLYAACLVGGFGCGLVMAAGGRIALRCFGERRGLAIGIVSMAYGLGPVLAVVPIQRTIAAYGYQEAFIVWGVVQACVLLAAAWFLVEPTTLPPSPPAERPAGTSPGSAGRGKTPAEVLRTPVFWWMYAIMTLVAFGGLLITAQLAQIAASFGLPKTFLLFGLGGVTLAIVVDRVMNAAARPFWGWVSDFTGRPAAMAAAFGCEALAVFLLIQTSGHPVAFILLSGVTFFAWGEIFSLFPALIADVFGSENAMTHYGLLFTAKGTASLAAGWGAARLIEAGASWSAVLWGVLACDVAAALLTWFLLKPAVAAGTETHCSPAGRAD